MPLQAPELDTRTFDELVKAARLRIPRYTPEWTDFNESVNLMAVGANYGNDNLNQLDVRFSKRLRFTRTTFRVDFDAYNLFNSFSSTQPTRSSGPSHG